jgi:hypothetical protein
LLCETRLPVFYITGIIHLWKINNLSREAQFETGMTAYLVAEMPVFLPVSLWAVFMTTVPSDD